MVAYRRLSIRYYTTSTLVLMAAMVSLIGCTGSVRKNSKSDAGRSHAGPETPVQRSSVLLQTVQVFDVKPASKEEYAFPYVDITDVDEPDMVQVWGVTFLDGHRSTHLVTGAQMFYDAETRSLRVGSSQFSTSFNPGTHWYEVRLYRAANYTPPRPGPTPYYLKRAKRCLPGCLHKEGWGWLKADKDLVCDEVYRVDAEPRDDHGRSMRCLCAILTDVDEDYSNYECSSLLNLQASDPKAAFHELDSRQDSKPSP